MGSYLEQLTPDKVVATTKALVENVAQFNFTSFASNLPQVDLPDLKPFLKAVLALHSRDWIDQGSCGGFITPESWREGFASRERYDGLHFSREEGKLQDAMGADHLMMKEALKEASGRSQSLGLVEERHMPHSLHVFRVFQRTATESPTPDAIFGLWDGLPEPHILRDWEVLLAINPLADAYRTYRQHKQLNLAPTPFEMEEVLRKVQDQVDAKSLGILDTPGIEWLGSLLVGKSVS